MQMTCFQVYIESYGDLTNASNEASVDGRLAIEKKWSNTKLLDTADTELPVNFRLFRIIIRFGLFC